MYAKTHNNNGSTDYIPINAHLMLSNHLKAIDVLLISLVDAIDQKGFCTNPDSHFGQWLGLSEKNVATLIDNLIRAGYLSCIITDNDYRLLGLGTSSLSLLNRGYQ